MKHYLFLVVLTAFVLFVFCMAFAGCSTENPLCTDNFCVTGEIFPRSELDDDTTFSEVAIDDSVILASLVGTPIPVETLPDTPETDNVTLADIVADAGENGTNSVYVEQTVTIAATVRFNLVVNPGTGKAITLVTGVNNVTFFVTDFDTPETLRHYVEGETYTFTLFIEDILPSTANPDKTSIWSHEVD